jgi:hypothetical protein
MAEISPAQIHDLLTATQDFIHAADAASQARDHLDHTFLDVARTAKVGLRELAAVTGLHHSAIRAAIHRAIGPGLPDGWEQPSLIEFMEAIEPMRPLRPGRTDPTPSNSVTRPAPAMAL